MGSPVKGIDVRMIAGVVLFLLGISIGLAAYFVCPGHSLVLNIIAAAVLFTSIRVLSKHNLPVLKLLAGITLTIALFSHAYFIESLLSAVLGFLMMVASAVEFRKDTASTI
ncbi:MAG: hypothetical protein JW705_06515 [Methanosarcinaceae archaeon]|nr:hypothetical protein [Methanosarcinaceae archaeon]